MASEINNQSKHHQPESVLAGISDSILHGLTTPVELFTRSSDQKQNQKNQKDLADFRENSRDYLKEGLKTAAMFMRGKTGLIATVATQALDEWKPEDTKHQLLDLGLGAAKGAALTYVFRKTAMVDSNIKFFPSAFNVPLQAAKLGLYSRIPTVGLTRSTWADENDKFDAQRTGNILLASTASIGTDIVAGIFTHGLVKSTNRLTGDAVAHSPMLSTMLVGSGYGMSNGAASEIFRQQAEQKQFDITKLDYGKIAGSALLQGAIDSVAAIPGGHQAEREALMKYRELDGSDNKVSKVPPLKTRKQLIDESGKTRNDMHPNHTDRCCMRLTAGEQKQMTYKPQKETTQATFDRIADIQNMKKDVVVYHARSKELRTQSRSFVVYQPKDHDAQICVPRKFNDSLQDIRQMRFLNELAPKPLFANVEKTALPEDLIPLLDGLPNSRLVKEMRLLNEVCPEELKEGYNEHGHSMATTDQNGRIEYYRQDNNPDLLRTITNHEYAHLVSYANKQAQEAYDCACRMEQALKFKFLNFRDYARQDTHENFAVHLGEVLLAPSPKALLEAVRYAPIRMAVLTKALHWTLNELPAAQVSKYEKQFAARVNMLEKHLVQPVIDKLKEEIKSHPEPPAEYLRILSFLGGEKEIKATLDTKLGLHELSDYLMAEGNWAEAEQSLRYELAICKKLYGNSHQETKSILDGLVSSLCLQGKNIEAIPYLVQQFHLDSQKPTPHNWEQMKFTLEELLAAYEQVDHIPGQIHWLRQLHSHLDTHFNREIGMQHKDVIQRLLELLPDSRKKEKLDLQQKDTVLDIMLAAMEAANATP